MTDLPSLLHQAAQAAADLHATLADRPVARAVDSGALRARFVGLAVARHRVLAEEGWDVDLSVAAILSVAAGV